MAETQRAYTLRLKGLNPKDNSWHEYLWLTHEAVNNGAKVFGDWLLTMRGGLDHSLADKMIRGQKGRPARKPTSEERKARRILLALSWLSVESELGAPKEYIVATGLEDATVRGRKVTCAFEQILEGRGLSRNEINEWVEDCSASLYAAIRKDAVWVNRSKAFEDANQALNGSIVQDEIWDFLGRFFGGPETYFAFPGDSTEDSESVAQAEAEKDLVQKAGQWLSSRFGTGKGADFTIMAKIYKIMEGWASEQKANIEQAKALSSLIKRLSKEGFNPNSPDLNGVLGLISGPGYKSATRNLLSRWAQRNLVTLEDFSELKQKAASDAKKCSNKSGDKGYRLYSDAILGEVEQACGFTYLTDENSDDVPVSKRSEYPSDAKWGAARHKEFAVMLDHAARRVSATHTWIKHAEANRAKFEEDKAKIANVPEPIRRWLDDFCESRGEITGALDSYRIRRRAVDGWREVVAAWSKNRCRTGEERIAEARRLQEELEKFGDIQLFEALAAEDALCVWHEDGVPNKDPTPEPLLNYAAAMDAEFKSRRFKVPSYRHPHPLLHPVFCDFGESRWTIDYSLHRAAKEIGKVEKRVEKAQDAVKKAEANLRKCAGTGTSGVKAAEKLQKAKKDLEKERRRLEFLSSPNRVALKLWTGENIEEVHMRWHSKRMARDLAVVPRKASSDSKGVTRADRLGRAASGAQYSDSVEIIGLCSQKTWNGRLQAPRDQLERIARHIKKHGCDEKAQKMKGQIKWMLTFSAKLQPQGPWSQYAREHGLNINPNYWPHSDANKNRGDEAKLILCRLPGLRVLSVDLGHRYAAACAVWETLSGRAFKEEVRGREILYGGAKRHDLFCHTKHQDENGKEHVTIYRRIGSDVLPDGTQHPAPWARLDRQFLIKLQGESECAREASIEEMWQVHRMEESLERATPLIDRLVNAGWGHTEKQKERLRKLKELGWQPISTAEETSTEAGEDETLGYRPRLSVDELMAYAVRIMRLALKRHSDCARIAFAMTATYKTLPGGRVYYFYEARGASAGVEENVRHEERISFLQDALVRWHGLISSPGWSDERARRLWDEHIAGLQGHEARPCVYDNVTCNDLREAFRTVAEALESNENLRIHLCEAWTKIWEEDENRIKEHLRYLKDWLHPRGNYGNSKALRHTGGLSLIRLATMTDFRRKVQVGFFMRLRPDGTRAEISEAFGHKALDDLERMREQRVKQLASRIVEAALGIGSENQAHWHGSKRPIQPIKDPRFSPCHAVVIESLSHYRPDETRTRRENRQLMSWSVARIQEYLANECLLYGLHLREVSASYTSRQDSRTGAPGIRCHDVPVIDFMRSTFWRKEVRRALQKQAENKGDARDRYLCKLDAEWAEKSFYEWKRAGNIRIPLRGGEIFVSSDKRSPSAKGIQADLNAAANIGLRALLDPDWPGRWWYIRCDSSSYKPLSDKVKGSSAVDATRPLKIVSVGRVACENSGRRKERQAKKKSREVLNMWRDVSARPVTAENGPWYEYVAYWNQVQADVVNILLQSKDEENGLS